MLAGFVRRPWARRPPVLRRLSRLPGRTASRWWPDGGPRAGTPRRPSSCSPSACWPSPLDWPPTPAVSAVARTRRPSARSPGFSRPAGAGYSPRGRGRAGGPQGRARCGCARGRGPAAATALPCRRPRARWRQRPQVVDLDLEVQHLRLLAGPFRPGRRLVPGLALDVEVHPACRVPQLCPVRRIEVAYLEPEQALVEAGDGSRVGAVDGDADPSDGGRAHVDGLA